MRMWQVLYKKTDICPRRQLRSHQEKWRMWCPPHLHCRQTEHIFKANGQELSSKSMFSLKSMKKKMICALCSANSCNFDFFGLNRFFGLNHFFWFEPFPLVWTVFFSLNRFLWFKPFFFGSNCPSIQIGLRLVSKQCGKPSFLMTRLRYITHGSNHFDMVRTKTVRTVLTLGM